MSDAIAFAVLIALDQHRSTSLVEMAGALKAEDVTRALEATRGVLFATEPAIVWRPVRENSMLFFFFLLFFFPLSLLLLLYLLTSRMASSSSTYLPVVCRTKHCCAEL